VRTPHHRNFLFVHELSQEQTRWHLVTFLAWRGFQQLLTHFRDLIVPHSRVAGIHPSECPKSFQHIIDQSSLHLFLLTGLIQSYAVLNI